MIISFALFFQVFVSQPASAIQASVPTYFAKTAAECKSATFFGIPGWYRYLPDNNFDGNCAMTDEFSLFGGSGKTSGFVYILLAIVDILMRLAALAAIAFVIVGGFKYMTAQGEPAQIKSAHQTLVGAVAGLLIAILAASIVSFIGNRIG